MKKFYSFLGALLISFTVAAQDTFSIVAVDPVTGDIGSAGASCVTISIIDIITIPLYD